MNFDPVYRILFNLGLSLVLSLTISAYIRSVTQAAMKELCPSGSGVVFWIKLLDLQLLLVPLVLVAVFDPIKPNMALGTVLAGQVLVLLFLGNSVMGAIRTEQRRQAGLSPMAEQLGSES